MKNRAPSESGIGQLLRCKSRPKRTSAYRSVELFLLRRKEAEFRSTTCERATAVAPALANPAHLPIPKPTHERDSVNLFRKSSLALCLLAVCAIPAVASITVNSPSNGAKVSPQFTLSAVATTCSNQAVSAMGFSLDSSSNTTIVKSTSIDATVTATTGAHTLHVKAWGPHGAACDTDVAITVGATAGTANGVSVTTPGNDATVSSPFTLTADALTCSSQTVTAMGYGIDNGATTVVDATSINRSLTATAGAHTLHVKAWGNKGAECDSAVAITVAALQTVSSPPPSTSSGVVVSEPANNASVTSPFTLDATATSCSSQPVSAMGYSLDNSSSTAIVDSTSVGAAVTAAAGAHTLHVKAWGTSGASCVTNVAITVAAPASPPPAPLSNLTISSPANGASVTSPFNLAATASLCSSEAVTSIGYSLDGASATIASGTSVNTQISAAAGQHNLVLEAWGSGGAVCTSSVTVTVTAPSSPVNSVVPSDAISVSSIQALSNWKAQNDPGTNGPSSGSMSLVSSPSLSGNARQFNTSFSSNGGELYYANFGDDTTSTNFFYDGWVYLTSSVSSMANLEMDMNQVMPNGQTVILGFQCDGWSGTWDYTENAGTPTSPVDRWLHSSAPCNVRNWSTNTWHHVQIYDSRDDSGNITYHSVWLDGVESPINATVPSAFALGWGPSLITNFQVDGLNSGSNTVYLDNLTISRW